MTYTLPPLPYPYDALAPTIDELTMRMHHGKHHGAYVADLNAALDGADWAERPIEQLLADLGSVPDSVRVAVRDTGGGHVNHALFWDVMSPDGGGIPSGPLSDAINVVFGSVTGLKRQIRAAAFGRLGSGWARLIYNGNGLAVTSTSDQDSPLMEGHTPLLGVDVGDHAYCLKYQSRRPDHVDAWWNVVDWGRVAERYEAATGGCDGGS
jgi:Fe-Mn family superoxide dismutase